MWQFLEDLFTIGQNEVENNPLYEAVIDTTPDIPQINIVMGRAWQMIENVVEDLKEVINPPAEKAAESNILLWVLSGVIVYKVIK